jgi:hypothetical protein
VAERAILAGRNKVDKYTEQRGGLSLDPGGVIKK